MTNKAVARVLQETADLIELTGGNAFRARAFGQAARTLERAETSVDELLDSGRITELRGIGSSLAQDIASIFDSGSFPLRDQLLDSLPPGLTDLLRVKGLGAKRVRVLWQSLDITSLQDLEEAATTGRIAELKGFGAKTEAGILDQIALLRRFAGRRRYADAVSLAEAVRERLATVEGIARVEPAGDYRRALETLEALSFLIEGGEDEAVQQALSDFAAAPVGTDDDDPDLRARGRLDDGFELRIYGAEPGAWGTTLWRLTGPNAHCAAYVERFGPAPIVDAETEVYTQAGLHWIPPELRDDPRALDDAVSSPPPSLLTDADLRGVLHAHSTYSDGAFSLEDMARHTYDLGYAYFGICDHSRSLTVAHGLSIEAVADQQREIRHLNAAYADQADRPFRIFSGIESDILVDGSLDYPDDVLASFDLIVASIHSRFSMSEAEATERLVRAVANPYTTILGHPTGRLLLVREGYSVDHEAVLRACAEHGVAVELNANPYRLDLDWRWIRRAIELDVWIAVNPDAHSLDQISLMRWGVAVARKGGLTPTHCLNTLSLEAFSRWLVDRTPPSATPR